MAKRCRAYRTGKKKSGRKTEAILEAATVVFLKHGFEAANVDDIATNANVSKQTIYNNFNDKSDLFLATCVHIANRLGERLIGPIPNRNALRLSLIRYGLTYLELVLNKDTLAFHRLLIAEVDRFPEIGLLVHEASGARASAALADWLKEKCMTGEIQIFDLDCATDTFFALVRGQRQIRALLHLDEPMSSVDKRKAVELSVDIFLRAYAPTVQSR